MKGPFCGEEEEEKLEHSSTVHILDRMEREKLYNVQRGNFECTTT